MKQKVVISLQISDAKKKRKALKIAVGFPGVTSAKIDGSGKLELEGDGLDPVKLTSKLKKKLGFADLVSLKKGDEKDDEKDEKMMIMAPTIWPNGAQYYYPPQPYYESYDGYGSYNSNCTIM